MPSLAGRSFPVGWWLFPSAAGRSFPPHLVALCSFPLVLVIPSFPSIAVPSFSHRLIVPSVERLVFVVISPQGADYLFGESIDGAYLHSFIYINLLL